MHHPFRSVGARRATVLGIATTLLLSLPAPGAFGATDSLAAAQASITAAQQAADRASAAYDAGQTRFYQLQDDALVTRKSVATARAAQDRLITIVRQRAVSLYMQAGSTGFDVFRSTSNVLDASRRVTLAAAANAGDGLAVDQLRAATEDLNVRQASLRTELAGAKDALDDLHTQQQALEESVNEARQAEQQLRTRLEQERRANEYDSLVRSAQDAARSGSSSNGGSNGGSSDSGGDPGQIIVSGSWVCPVQGGVSFTDTFGAPRGNGRTHKGVDMFAGTGTPLVAVVSGSVFFQSDTLGGLAAYVQGNDGNTYYYAHLNDYVGGGRSVSGGELIGHVGNTGDASDGPSHLHFEIRPGGPNGIAIDPYPTVAAHC